MNIQAFLKAVNFTEEHYTSGDGTKTTYWKKNKTLVFITLKGNDEATISQKGDTSFDFSGDAGYVKLGGDDLMDIQKISLFPATPLSVFRRLTALVPEVEIK